MLNAEQIARALGNGSARREGSEWHTLCPVHEADGAPHNPSLGIGERNGVIVWKCRAGCEQELVTAALRERGVLNGYGTRPERRRERREVLRRISFPIRDITGVTQGTHVRIEFKDGSKRYEWEGGLNGRRVTSVPLEGSEALSAQPDGATAILCEGETAATAVRNAGLAAVATVTGAATIPDDTVLGCLVRFRVVLWPDNDDIGRQHMARIATRLIRLGCQDVRVIDWPDAPEAGDAADYERDDTAMLTLVESAKPFEPAPIFGKLASAIPDAQIEWIIKHHIARGTLCEIIGNPGDGKTYCAIAIAAGLTIGSWFGLSCAAGKVAVLSAEDSPEHLKQRLIAADANLDSARILPSAFESESGLTPLSLPDHISMIEDTLRSDKTLVLFIDPITAFLNGKTDSHNDASSRKVLAELAALAQRTGTAICLIRHMNKMGSVDKALYRGGGSIAFTAAARTSFLIGQDPTDQSPEIFRRRVMACVKSNLGPKPPSRTFVLRSDYDDQPAHLEWLEEPSNLTADDLLREPRQPRNAEALEQALSFLSDELANGAKLTREIEVHADELGISETTLKRARKKLGIQSEKRGFGKQGEWVSFIKGNEM